MADDQVLTDMLTMLDRSPEVLALRVCVIELLIERERYADALAHCGTALGHEPGNAQVLALMMRCTTVLSGGSPAQAATSVAAPATSASGSAAAPSAAQPDFDWAAAEDEVGDIIEPAFVHGVPTEFVTDDDAATVARPTLRLADVGGMVEVKQQLDLTLLGPLRNPELAKAFGTSARGGLLLYGPPGCGKTFLASAVAGELGANFYPIEITDILDIYTGASERNVHSIFEMARRNAPCVLFLDEVDALGHKRSQMQASTTMRTVVNQLLTEMDSATHSNEGVFVLGATNHPWDVDVALRRPGRFDRMIFVGLPDLAARTSILHYHLRDRPVAGIDLNALAAHTDGLSGADLAHVCTSATQLAMADSMRSGEVRPIGMADVRAALAQTRPSTGAWFESARNVVEFANGDGSYDELATYLRRMKRR
ncbi:ATP-binding protein [Nocardia fluminea]|uniref:ATPase family protein associated with various cellular activities (AAA) n=1 Tax=Nocardia fluminea TaxID=134984 RepID=A0A2N3WZM0_9NOCA|nr:ATP-binding protein [Nocardia fluminea]PKV99315.1 ATPase family protein associated with various cellular activities (AAA) [Nocardia fluminea]